MIQIVVTTVIVMTTAIKTTSITQHAVIEDNTTEMLKIMKNHSQAQLVSVEVSRGFLQANADDVHTLCALLFFSFWGKMTMVETSH